MEEHRCVICLRPADMLLDSHYAVCVNCCDALRDYARVQTPHNVMCSDFRKTHGVCLCILNRAALLNHEVDLCTLPQEGTRAAATAERLWTEIMRPQAIRKILADLARKDLAEE